MAPFEAPSYWAKRIIDHGTVWPGDFIQGNPESMLFLILDKMDHLRIDGFGHGGIHGLPELLEYQV